MRITFSNRIIAAVAGATIAVGMRTPACPGAGPVGRPAGDTVVQEAAGTVAQAAAVRYWTPARMAAALRAAASGQPAPDMPVSPAKRLLRKAPLTTPAAREPWLTGNTAGQGLAWTHGGAVATAVGKIFFTMGREDYVCSGAVVRGKQV